MFNKKKLQAKMMDAMKSNPALAEQMKRMETVKDQIQDLQNDPSKMEEMMKGPETVYPDLADVDYDGNRPRPIWGALLDQLNFAPNGKYGWTNFDFAFLPTKDVNGKDIRWVRSNIPENNEDRLHVEIYHDGDLIADHWMRAKDTSRITHSAHIATDARFTTNKDLLNHNSRLAPGQYEFVFKILDDVIYRLDAEIKAVPNPDRYADMKDILRFNGPFQKYLGVTFVEHQTTPQKMADKNVPLRITLYHRNPLVQFERSEQRLFGHLYYEGERIAYADLQLGSGHEWTYKSSDFTRWKKSADPREAGRVFDDGKITFEDMKDGQYKIVLFSTELVDERMLHFKRPDGAAKIEYDFEWKDGGFVLPDYMDDRKTDTTRMVEGLGDTIWLEPLNGPHPWLFDGDAKQLPATGKNSSWVDPDTREDDPWALNYSSADDPVRKSVNDKIDAISRGEMSFEETGLPEPDWESTGGDGYTYKTAVETAIHHYKRHKKAEADAAKNAAYKAQRAKEAEETKAEVAKAQAEAQDYAAQAAEEARKAQEEAQRMIEEMQKKHGF